VDLSLLTEFRKRILMLIRAIPYGEVRSYCDVAVLAGLPRAARAVGGAMAANPVPVIIPCHRIVAGNGRLTGYSAIGGLKMKDILLRMEGVEFKGLLAILK
jgi:methylated-DNA-[protein]-cysteine S-methyltransferase